MLERANFIERFKYPSSQDAKDALKFVPPSILLFTAGKVKPFSPNKSEVIAELGIDKAKTVDEMYKKVQLLALPGLVASLALFLALSYQETKNRKRYGEHLTVSKVALHPNSFGKKMFPELANEKYVGEMHFKGKWKLRVSKEENSITVMRKVFSDLYDLSLAVERNDPNIKDLNYFIGLSSMVSPILERFGMKVVHYKDQLGLPPLGQKDQSTIKLQMRPVMGALVSKEGLLKNKEALKKAGRK